MPSPLTIYATAGALVIGAAAGYKVRDWQCNAAYAKALEKAQKERAAKEKVVFDVSEVYEEERNQANVVATERTNTIREIYKTAPAIPVDCSAPEPVRRLLESSVRDANAASTGKSSSEVPNTSNPTNIFNRP
jgi:N-acetyl-gamma-glutamylphosphate reductase